MFYKLIEKDCWDKLDILVFSAHFIRKFFCNIEMFQDFWQWFRKFLFRPIKVVIISLHSFHPPFCIYYTTVSRKSQDKNLNFGRPPHMVSTLLLIFILMNGIFRTYIGSTEILQDLRTGINPVPTMSARLFLFADSMLKESIHPAHKLMCGEGNFFFLTKILCGLCG